MRTRAGCAVVAAAAIALGGCGAGDDEDQVRRAAEDWLGAVADGDGKTACSQMTDEAKVQFLDGVVAKVSDLGATSCQDAVTTLATSDRKEELAKFKDAQVTAAVSGEEATAEAEGARSLLQLERTEGSWKISGGLEQFLE